MTDRPGISLDAWFPLVEPFVPTPLTTIIHSPDLALLAYDNDPHAREDERVKMAEAQKALRALVRKIEKAALPYGYPFFLRTGLTSGKHNWENTCYVPNKGAIKSHVLALIEYSASVDIMGLPCDVWVVREMLETVPAFTAFGGRMPITRERRYFVKDGQVTGWHPYWPPLAIQQPSVVDWAARLDRVNAPIKHNESAELTMLTERIGAVLPGYWSVDWLWVVGRGWVLTDMAWAERSFVWLDHPNAPKDLANADQEE